MTNEEVIHKLEFSKRAYQKLIDECVDNGRFVGDGVEGEWKSNTPLNKAYKDMIEAFDLAILAIKTLEQTELNSSYNLVKSELEPQPRNCKTCIHSEERDGSNCYECIKGIDDNFEAQPTDVDCISREAVIKNIKGWFDKIELNPDILIDSIVTLPSVTPKPSEDCISRQAVLDYAKDTCLDLDKYEDTEVFCDEIKAMPSVTPTSEAIKEAYLKGYDYGVKDWFKSKTQPCEDAVNRKSLEQISQEYMDSLKNLHEIEALMYVIPLVKRLLELPSVTPQPKVGHWIYTPKRRLIDETDEGCVYITDYRCSCSECGGDFGFQKMSDAYCKYCGAKMEVEE